MTDLKLHNNALFLTDEGGPKTKVEFDATVFDVDHDADAVTVGLSASARLAPTKLVVASGGALVIATGAITVTGSRHAIDTEEEAAADDLDTISGGEDGQVLILEPADPARVVTVTDADNIALSTDFIMDDATSRLTLQYDGAAEVWVELARANGGA